jgi:quercetin dioxygenase-like cupin family protein
MDTTPAITVLRQSDLPWASISHEFVGADHGGVGVCLAIVDAEPGRRVDLHQHDYDELLVVLEGEATLLGGAERVVRGGELVIVPAGAPHGFVNSGSGRLRQIDIHVSPKFLTTWLSGSASATPS